MNMGWAPRVVVIEPGIRARFDGDEAVRAVLIRQGAASTAEIRIQRSGMLVLGMSVAAGRVGLPNLDEGARDGPSITVKNASAHDDALAEGFTRMLCSQIVVFFSYSFMPEDRSGNLRQ